MSKLVVCETERRERKTVSEEVFSFFLCLFFYLYVCINVSFLVSGKQDSKEL